MSNKSQPARGLAALYASNAVDNSKKISIIRISLIEPNRNQPRKHFNNESLSELAQSISEQGIIQPIIVKPMLDGRYQIISGERRWRASRIANLSEIPCIVRDVTEEQQMQIAMIENLQREDLSPLEEAEGYKAFLDKFDCTQENLAKYLGKSRPVITNALRLLNLPDDVRTALTEKKISAGHARLLASLEESKDMSLLLNEIIANNLSVRELENAIKQMKTENQISENIKEKSHKSENWGTDEFKTAKELEAILQNILNTKVKINSNGKKGKITIDFSSTEHLKQLIEDLLNKMK